MKTLLGTIVFILLAIACNGQPNTVSTIKVGIVNTQLDKSFLVFADIQDDSSSSVLVDGIDYLDPDISGKIVILENVTQSGDTTWGYIEYPDQPTPRFAKGGLVQVNDINNKYSAMTASYWIELDTIEGMNAGFIWVLD